MQKIGGYDDTLAPVYDATTEQTTSLTGNNVTLNSGTVYQVDGALNYADKISDTSGNTVTINDGTVAFAVLGGGSTGNCTGNSVIINGGIIHTIGADDGGVSGGYGVVRSADNTVTMNGGTVYGMVSGGAGDNVVENNKVIITGGTVIGEVSPGAGIDAMNNTLTISGAPNLSEAVLDGGGGVTGNTLDLHSANMAAAGLQNFQYLNFYVPGSLGNNGVMLSVNGQADIQNATVNVGIEGSSQPLEPDAKIILIDAKSLTGRPANSTADGSGMQGVTLQYNFYITPVGNQLIASLRAIELSERTKALSEGFLSGLILLRQGGDLVAGQGIRQAVDAAARTDISRNYGLNVFGAVSGGWSRYNTGSHADISSVSLLAGVSKGMDFTPGRLTLGGFVEYGAGSYDTYNSFSNAASVHGKGDVYHVGGGVLGRMDFTRTGPGAFYAEGDVRAGGVRHDFRSSNLRDSQGRKAKYDASSPYYSAHAGAGYVWNLSEKASLDLYGKYFWTRQEGDSVRLSTGESVRFRSADSHRLRFGGRLAYAAHERISPFVGAAYEHEFDGKSRASTNGYLLDTPDLKGGTGIGEAGVIITPSATLPLTINLGVQGYVGKREGVSGSLRAVLEF